MSSTSRTSPPPKSRNLVLGFAKPFGGACSSFSSSIAGFTLDAFSRPTSISILIPRSSFRFFTHSPVLFPFCALLLRVNFFHLPNRPRIVRTRLIKAVQRRNLVVIGARQRILRLNHFYVVCHSSLEAVARLLHFFLCQLHSQGRYSYLVAR